MPLFAVIRTRGPAWQDSRPLEGQADGDGHAVFMNALAREGFVVALADLLRISRITPWTLRLGSLTP